MNTTTVPAAADETGISQSPPPGRAVIVCRSEMQPRRLALAMQIAAAAANAVFPVGRRHVGEV
jgi:hypothetical protein